MMDLSLLKNWWWLTVNGVAALLFGLVAVLYQSMSLVLLLAYFGMLALFLGAFFMLGGYLNRRETSLWDFWFFEGILNASIGLILLFHNNITLPLFLVLLALWAILVGAIQIISVIRLWSGTVDKYLYLLNGGMAFVFAFLVIINPFSGVDSLTVFIGTYTIILGLFSIVISLRMKKYMAAGYKNRTQDYTYHHQERS